MTNAYGKFVDLLTSRGWGHEDTRLPDGFKQNEKAMVAATQDETCTPARIGRPKKKTKSHPRRGMPWTTFT